MSFLHIISVIPKYLISFLKSRHDNILIVSPTYLFETLYFFRKNTNFKYDSLVDISCTDYPDRVNRFEVSYHLLSYLHNSRIMIKTYTDELTPLSSVESIYSSASWSERENWDMFGVFFEKNNDLRRILTDYGFDGHPLRKDFPLSGYHELVYDNKSQSLSKQYIELTQEFRLYNYLTHW